MLKLIWMSDLHFSHDGDVLEHDPRIRLQAAIDHVNDHHSDADLCVISGDIVNRGQIEDYTTVETRLRTLPVSYLPMVGNHDNRALFRQIMPLPKSCMDDFIQYTVSTKDGLIVCLDTHKTGSDAGEFCKARSAWLRETLTSAGTTPVLLFMHHPPLDLGLPMQDTEKLEDGDQFLDLIEEFDCVAYIFIGHVHRAITGTVRGIPFSTMPSVLYQAPPPRPNWTWETFRPGKDAPSLGVIRISGASVVLQYDQFCDYDVGISETKS
jgi:Icc protein